MVVDLFVIEGSDAGEGFAFEEFERGAATGADVGHFVGETGLGDSGGGVAAADHDLGAIGGEGS